MVRRFLCFLFLCLFSFHANATLKIDVSGAKTEPIPLALPVFSVANPAMEDLSVKITQIVRQDLEGSALFRIIDEDAYLQVFNSLSDMPQFSDWQAINAQGLVQGELEQNPSGDLKITFRLWDVYTNQQLMSKSINATPDKWRKIAHIVSDMIYERMTGDSGYFDTKIVFVSESGSMKRRKRRLAMMDQDGAGLKFLTDNKSMVMTPRFSPNMKEVAYLSYQSGEPQVYVMSLETGDSKLIGKFGGMSFAPRFSPDGRYLLMSLSKHGNSEIYAYDLKTSTQQQLTTNPAIDTSPSFSPDGKQIVFNSDRAGTQQLYIMDRDGGNVHRISYGEGTYATPLWSPRGDYIAFTKIKDGTFYIGLMRPDGSAERLIADGFLVEGPSWAPNGRLITFARQERGKGTYIYRIDVSGYNEQRIKTPDEATDPAWSGLLH